MSDIKAAIVKALGQLDPKNDDHWTSDGLPRLDALKVSGVKRGDVTDAAPNFTRDNPNLEAPAAAGGESTSGQGAEGAPTPGDDQAQEGGDQEQAQDEGGRDGDDEQGDEGDGDEDEGDEPSADIADDLDEAELAVIEAKARLEEVEAAAAEVKKEVDAAQAEHDRLVAIRDANKRPHQDMEDRLAFIQRQQAERARRAGVAQEALKGVNLDHLDPRSPLDRSMARKKGFGHRARPQVPLKKAD